MVSIYFTLELFSRQPNTFSKQNSLNLEKKYRKVINGRTGESWKDSNT